MDGRRGSGDDHPLRDAARGLSLLLSMAAAVAGAAFAIAAIVTLVVG